MLKKLALICILLASPALGQQNFNRGLMLESGWKLIRPDYTIETGERSLVQGWDVTSVQVDDALAFLESYATEDNIQESRIVTIPKGDLGNQEYAGRYIIGRAYWDDQRKMVIRVVHRITTINAATGIADLTAAESVKTRDSAVVNLFSLLTGLGDQQAYVWRGLDPASETVCMETITDSELIAAFGVGWTFAERRWQIEKESGTATFVVSFRKADFSDWDDQDKGTYTSISYSNPERLRDAITKEWCSIAIADATNAVEELYGAAFTTDGYVVVTAGFRDNKDGSVCLTQVQVGIEVTNAVESTMINKFGTNYSLTHQNMTNALTQTTTFTNGAIITTRDTINAHSLHDHTYATNSSAYTTNAAVSSFSEFGGTSITRIHNAEGILAPTAFTADGTMVSSSVSWDVNRYGRFDSSKVTMSHTALTNVSNGAFGWTVHGPQTYLTVTYFGDDVNSTARYYKSWDHVVTLYNTKETAWEARDSDSTTNQVMNVGQFDSGIYFYHTVKRGATDVLAAKP